MRHVGRQYFMATHKSLSGGSYTVLTYARTYLLIENKLLGYNKNEVYIWDCDVIDELNMELQHIFFYFQCNLKELD